MNTQRTRRLLIVAFALSLLIHVLFAANVRWQLASPEESVEHVTYMHIMHFEVPRAHTPPTATPAPPRPRIAPSNIPISHSTPSGSGGTEVAAVGTQASAAPTPIATPAPSPTADCMKTDALVAMTASPPPVDIPADARADSTNGTTHVQVDLNDHAVITAVAISKSSGNPALDIIAETAARAAQYSAATHACKPVASSYDFTMKWVPW